MFIRWLSLSFFTTFPSLMALIGTTSSSADASVPRSPPARSWPGQRPLTIENVDKRWGQIGLEGLNKSDSGRRKWSESSHCSQNLFLHVVKKDHCAFSLRGVLLLPDVFCDVSFCFFCHMSSRLFDVSRVPGPSVHRQPMAFSDEAEQIVWEPVRSPFLRYFADISFSAVSCLLPELNFPSFFCSKVLPG